MGMRKLQFWSRMSIGALTASFFFLVLSSASVAQQTPIVHHASRSKAHFQEKLPRSVPSSAVPGTATTAARRNELNRLEQSGTHTLKPATSHSAGSARNISHSSSLPKSRAGNAPINFTYHGPKNGEAGHHNAATQPH